MDVVKVKKDGSSGVVTLQLGIEMPFTIRSIKSPTHNIKMKVKLSQNSTTPLVICHRLHNLHIRLEILNNKYQRQRACWEVYHYFYFFYFVSDLKS